MKKNLKKKILSILTLYLSIFLCLFSVFVCGYTFVTSFLFHHYSLSTNYIGYIFIVSIIASVVLFIILSIDKLNFLFQIILVHLVISICTYFIGFYTNSFTNTNKFWIFSILINLLGLFILLAIAIIKHYMVNKMLNEKLKDFKERDN